MWTSRIATRVRAMAILTDPDQVPTHRSATPAPAMALSLSGVLSVASSVVQSYPSITSAYLFGSHAKGTAHPDSDVDIALFLPSFCWLKDIGGVHMDLESAFGRKVDLAVCPHDEFVERIKMYWIPIDLRGEPVSLYV